MRKIAKQQDQGGAEIDLTPMLDVVFIMLIFFYIVFFKSSIIILIHFG